MKNDFQFNIRVYGIVFNEKNEILISDEYQMNTKMTKFPGGGLNFGEGPIDCLVREMWEECQQKIKDVRHFYTTHFFQKSFYHEKSQIINIYYTARLDVPINIKISEKPFNFNELKNGMQSFRFVKGNLLNVGDFTLPIDKHVVNLLQNKQSRLYSQGL